MRMTLDLPDEMFRQLKAETALRGAKMKDVIAQFIERGLAERSAPSPQRRERSPLPVLRAPTGTPHPAFSNAELDDVLSPDWLSST